MRRWLSPLFVMLVCRVARGDEPPKPPVPPTAPVAKPAPPPTIGQAADAVLTAVLRKDDAVLRALATRDEPDPWLVADDLIGRGQHDAAAAFAAAAPGQWVARLPAYVASRRAGIDDSKARDRLGSSQSALDAGRLPEALAATGTAEEPVPLEVVGIRLRCQRGIVLRKQRRWEEAERSFTAAARAAESIGWLWRAVTTYRNAASSAYAGSSYAAMLAADQAGLRIAEALGDVLLAAKARVNVGLAYSSLGELPSARDAYRSALEVFESRGEALAAAMTRDNIGLVHFESGEFEQALAAHALAETELVALGAQGEALFAVNSIGRAQLALGRLSEAAATFSRAVQSAERIDDASTAAQALGNLGAAYVQAGDYARALASLERAVAEARALGNRADVAVGLGNIGAIYRMLGDYPRALSTLESARVAFESIGNRSGAARSMINVAAAYQEQGNLPRAMDAYEQALAQLQAAGNRQGIAATLHNVGQLHLDRGDSAQGVISFERALAASKELGDRHLEGQVLASLGRAHSKTPGGGDRAIELWEHALAIQVSLGAHVDAVTTLTNLAVARDKAGAGAEALAAARRGAAMLPLVVGGLGEERGSLARERFAALFSVGARAAVAKGDVAEATAFLERGRASSFLEALGSRDALRASTLPEALRTAEAEARAKQAAATAALHRAQAGGDLATIRDRRKALVAAESVVVEVSDRLEREAKAASNLLGATAAPLEEIQRSLAADQALIVYYWAEEFAIALVVTPATARLVSLPSLTAEIVAEAGLALSDSTSDAAGPLGRLRRAAAEPLALPTTVRCVLVAPDGDLSRVPASLLFGDREVACVPSGTAYARLLDDDKVRGVGVLALGDPDYESRVDERATGIYVRGGSGRLARLPATADEANAVGEPVLLGREATEKALREAVAKRPRWRAVHLACHGLIDAERPSLSSLALTPEGEDDGFLTVLEVFGSRIPADLAVLSACETGKGRIVKGEGVVGLARAFMYAGSPRVICSLWKVDDDATRALMVRFYELWNPKEGKPGLSTAEALRQAQAFVREDPKHPKWKHPFYWAAWVLWGLPS